MSDDDNKNDNDNDTVFENIGFNISMFIYCFVCFYVNILTHEYDNNKTQRTFHYFARCSTSLLTRPSISKKQSRR